MFWFICICVMAACFFSIGIGINFHAGVFKTNNKQAMAGVFTVICFLIIAFAGGIGWLS